jgi:NAD-dependent deacetylase
VLELHGNATRARCLDCAAPYTRDEVHEWLEAGVAVPACPACGGVIKPFTVLFGEAMPPRRDAGGGAPGARGRSVRRAGLVAGRLPGGLPAGATRGTPAPTLVIVNLEPTPHDARADLVIRAGPERS